MKSSRFVAFSCILHVFWKNKIQNQKKDKAICKFEKYNYIIAVFKRKLASRVAISNDGDAFRSGEDAVDGLSKERPMWRKRKQTHYFNCEGHLDANSKWPFLMP